MLSGINLKSPWVLGGAGLLFVVLLIGSRSGGNNNASLGVASQNIATGANVQLAEYSTALQAENMQTMASRDVAILGLTLGYLTKNNDNLVAMKSIDAGVNVHTSDNQTLLRLTSVNNATYEKIAPALANIAAANQQALATISGNTATSIAGINANVSRDIANIASMSRQNDNIWGQGGVAQNAGGILSGIGQGIGGIMSIFGL